jgi:hypothetical protein
MSPWLPPDGFTVDFLHRLLILGQRGGMPAAPSTESSAYRANVATTISSSSSSTKKEIKEEAQDPALLSQQEQTRSPARPPLQIHPIARNIIRE